MTGNAKRYSRDQIIDTLCAREGPWQRPRLERMRALIEAQEAKHNVRYDTAGRLPLDPWAEHYAAIRAGFRLSHRRQDDGILAAVHADDD